MPGQPEGPRPVTYCLPFYPHRQWNGILCSPARRLGLGSLQSSAQRERRSWLLPPRSYGRVSQSKQECPGAPWPRWDGSSSRETLSYRRSGSVPSLGDGAGLTMAWDESLGMERQSSDKMVARDSGMAAIALKPLPPTRHAPVCHVTEGHREWTLLFVLSLEGLCFRPSWVPEPSYIPTCNATVGLALMWQLRATSPPMAAISTG